MGVEQEDEECRVRGGRVGRFGRIGRIGRIGRMGRFWASSVTEWYRKERHALAQGR